MRTQHALSRLGQRGAGNAGHPVFLVDLEGGSNLFDLVVLTEELSEALGVEVNVLTEGSLSRYLRDAILAATKPKVRGSNPVSRV